MDNANAGSSTYNDPAPDRLAHLFRHATATAIGALPRPVPATPEAFTARNITAVSQIAALVPVNAAETMFAVQIVISAAQGADCQRQAQDHDDPDEARRHIRDAATMMRVSQGAARVLLSLQAERRRREATPESANSAALTEHCALQLMLHALTKLEADKAAADKAAAEQEEAEAAEKTNPYAPLPELEPLTTDHIVAAEEFATSNPTNRNRARIIRYRRRMPDWGMFIPPSPEVINALIYGHSPILDTLLPGPNGC